MLILAVDTALQQGWATLGRDGELLASRALDPGRTYSATLQPAVRDMLSEQGLSPAGLEGLAVDLGPGFFTGMRIGIAFTLGLALALDLEVAPLSSLALLAAGADAGEGPVWAVSDARRGLVYAAPFQVEDGPLPRALGQPAALPPDRLAQRLEAPCVLVGDGALLYQDVLLRPGIAPASPQSRELDPAAMARQAQALFSAGAALPAERVSAAYVRPSDAEVRFGLPLEGYRLEQ
jgi:tRNA threonylcarbamoyladenosine biosynthesis protein TsaB